MSIAPARPQDIRAADGDVITLIEELRVRLLQCQSCAAVGDVSKIESAMLVVAGQRLDPQRMRIHPAEPRNVILTGGERHLHPRIVTGGHVDHAHPNHRIRVAWLGIALHLHRSVRRNPIRDGILRHRRFIHLQVRDALRVGRPEVVAAHVQLFQIQPVHFAIQQRGITRAGEPHHGLGVR